MSENNQAEWKKELAILLDKIQTYPSQDSTETRERIRVLNTLIASHEQKVEA